MNRSLSDRKNSTRSMEMDRLRPRAGALTETLEPRRLFSTYTVNTLSDAIAVTPGMLTLRQAVADANAHAGADAINFAASLFATAGLKTITLAHGEIDFSDTSGATTVTGPGAASLAVSGNKASRVFGVAAKTTVTLKGLTVTNGAAPVGSDTNSDGGGIFNAGTLTLNAVTVSNSSARGVAPAVLNHDPGANDEGQAHGGGIYSTGGLTLQASTVTGNSALGAANENYGMYATGGYATGGGVYCSGPLSVTGSTVSKNTATGGKGDGKKYLSAYGGSAGGAGIFTFGPATITQSTVSANTATGGAAVSQSSYAGSYGGSAGGAGISCDGSLTLSGSTLSNNAAVGGTATVGNNSQSSFGGTVGGGAVACSVSAKLGKLTITATTFSNNSATSGFTGATFGGDAFGGAISAFAVASIANSSFTGNSAVTGNLASADFTGQDSMAQGGAIYNVLATTLQSDTITGNKAVDENAMGGGVYALAALSVAGSTISGNAADSGVRAASSPNRGLSQAQGGGLFSNTTLSLSQSTVSNNTAVGGGATTTENTPGEFSGGGGVFVAGTATISQSRITGNSATGGSANYGGAPAYGGGLLAQSSTTISASTISGNIATGGSSKNTHNAYGAGGNADGGGIFLKQSTLHLSQSTVANNTAKGGLGGAGSPGDKGGDATAGIYAASGTVRAIDSTIADNTATGGIGGAGLASATPFAGGVGGNAVGGIFSAQGLQVYDSTISANTATGGAGGAGTTAGGKTAPAGAKGAAVGGISNPSKQGLLDNTIVSANKGNSVFSDIAGSIEAASASNLIGVGGGLTNGVNGNQVGVTDPKLSPVGNYGGPTQTLLPLLGSPAIDAGNNSLIPSGVTTDQRGLARIYNKTVDIGADEFSQIVITGSVYNDLNGDGARQSGEPGLANWQVYVDVNDVGVYVNGDPMALTNSAGVYTLTDTITTTSPLIIREARPNTWRRTQPAGLYPLGYYSLSPSATTANNINFGDSATALIEGTVYHDLNHNGQLDPGEPGLANWQVLVDTYVNGTWQTNTFTTKTDSKGNYALVLAAGKYRLHEVPQAGLQPTSPPAAGYTLTLTTGATAAGENFGND